MASCRIFPSTVAFSGMVGSFPPLGSSLVAQCDDFPAEIGSEVQILAQRLSGRAAFESVERPAR